MLTLFVMEKINDDLWHAVIGGASGSFGVVGEYCNDVHISNFLLHNNSDLL
jgi:hypothetical protein